MKIELSEADRIPIHSPLELFEVMQRILIRDDHYKKNKEHFWIVGFDAKGIILYIELLRFDAGFDTPIAPMSAYRIAVLKNATTVVAVHSQPEGSFTTNANEEDCLDRLIQVGRILEIEMKDYLIINQENFQSSRESGLMETLEKSLKYVPRYKIIEQIRQEEKAIANEAIKAEQDLRIEAEGLRNKMAASAINYIIKQGCTNPAEIAEILGIALTEVEQIFKNTKIDKP